MKIPLWVHQFGNAYPGLAGSDDRRLPVSAVYGKTHDGLRWMDTWDAHSAAISGLAAVVRAERDIYAPQGIDYVPWGVVHGRWEGGGADYATREGLLAGEVAKAAAGPGQARVFIVDLEPYYHAPFPAFWRSDIGAGDAEIAAFMHSFSEEGGAELWIAPDAREPHLTPVNFRRWVASSLVTRVMPQVYYTDFVRPRTPTADDARAALDRALDTLARHGWPEAGRVFPILPGNSPPDVLRVAVEYCREVGCGGVSVWHRGNLSRENAEVIAGLPDWEPPDSALTLLRRIHADSAAAIAALSGTV